MLDVVRVRMTLLPQLAAFHLNVAILSALPHMPIQQQNCADASEDIRDRLDIFTPQPLILEPAGFLAFCDSKKMNAGSARTLYIYPR